MFDVISIGAATVDIFIKSKDLLVENNTFHLPYSAKTEISQSLICSGGGATNSSVSFSRLGLKSAAVALFGDDLLKHYIIFDLQKDKVDTSFLVHPKKETTDFSVILVAADGGRTVFTNRGNSRLEEKHFNWSKIKATKWFYITSLEGNLDLLEKLIGFALEHSIKISLNPGNRELSQKAKLIPLLKYVDFFLLNKEESENFTSLPISHQNFWTKLNTFGARLTAVTNGRLGANILLSSGENFYSPIINSHPVDETGAGDSFGSTFVAGLIHSQTPQNALFWSMKNSASVVSKLGAKPGLLTLKQIKK